MPRKRQESNRSNTQRRGAGSSRRDSAERLAAALRAEYPDADCELVFQSPHELLVATILSAQATDVSVNKATPALFARFPSPAAFAAASPAEIEPYIKSIGLYRNKAKSIHEAMKSIVERFNGEVPRTMEELLTLRGVARKTANVVLGNAFGINDGFVVDTHINRLSQRFGLVPKNATVQAVERHLMELFPQALWRDLSHQLIWHGRRACKARMSACAANSICQEFGACCELRQVLGAAKGASEGPKPQKSAPKRKKKTPR